MEDHKGRKRLANNLILLIKEKLRATEDVRREVIDKLEEVSRALDPLRALDSSIGGCSIDGECFSDWSKADCQNPSIHGTFLADGCPNMPLQGTHEKPARVKTGAASKKAPR